MKFSSYLSLFAITFSSVTAHISIKNPLPRGHPLNPNAQVKDTACITSPFNGGPGCAPKPFPCGGYPIDAEITQVLKAGEVINVSFWNPNFPNGPKAADVTADQARHNGGTCEFALSYDGGFSYTVIATYHKTCPDIFFDWKVKIPKDAPSCDTRGQCIFSWSWINAVGNREFYQNCADVKIQGNATKPLPIKDITRANFLPLFTNIITPDGDPANTGDAKGSGPQQSDVSINLGSSLSGSSDKVSTTIPKKTTPTQGSGKPNATNLGKTTRKPNTVKPGKPTTGKKNAANPGKPTTGKKNAAKTNASTKLTACSSTLNDASSSSNNAGTSSSSTTPTKGSCTTNGEMKCVNGGDFTTCANGILVTRKCPSGTVCIQDHESIQCGRQSRKF